MTLPPLPEPKVYASDAFDAYTTEQLREYARAAIAANVPAVLAAAPQAVPVPAGWVLVPVEPTEDMLFSAEMSKVRGYRDLYNAMLAAAPKEQPHE